MAGLDTTAPHTFQHSLKWQDHFLCLLFSVRKRFTLLNEEFIARCAHRVGEKQQRDVTVI